MEPDLSLLDIIISPSVEHPNVHVFELGESPLNNYPVSEIKVFAPVLPVHQLPVLKNVIENQKIPSVLSCKKKEN